MRTHRRSPGSQPGVGFWLLCVHEFAPESAELAGLIATGRVNTEAEVPPRLASQLAHLIEQGRAFVRPDGHIRRSRPTDTIGARPRAQHYPAA